MGRIFLCHECGKQITFQGPRNVNPTILCCDKPMEELKTPKNCEGCFWNDHWEDQDREKACRNCVSRR